ncbi:hypothetical protein [Gilliamella sp. Bif1-4]
MDHNFHIHGAQFIVQSHELNGKKLSLTILP